MAGYDDKRLQPVQSLLEDLGQQVEAYRISRGLKQSDLAKAAGISVRTLIRLEAGDNSTLDTLMRVMRAFGIETRVDTLFPDAQTSPLQPGSATGKRPQRVRDKATPKPKGWSWGDEAEE